MNAKEEHDNLDHLELVVLDDFPAKVVALTEKIRAAGWGEAPWPVVEVEDALSTWSGDELLALARCLEINTGLGICPSVTKALTASLTKLGRAERLLAIQFGLRTLGHMHMAKAAGWRSA